MCDNPSHEKMIQELKEENRLLRELLDELSIKVERIKPSYANKPNKKTHSHKPGAKPGHVGHGRRIPDKVDETVNLKMRHCPHCNSRLSQTKEVRDRYVTGIRKIRITKKYRCRVGYCRNCEMKIYPKPANALSRFRLDTNVMIEAATEKFQLGVTYNKIQSELENGYGLKVSSATPVNHASKIASFLNPDYEAISNRIRNSDYVNADETGWRVNGTSNWLWSFRTNDAVLIKIDRRRSGKVVEGTLGKKYGGILVTDFFSAYFRIDCRGKQKCLVHLFRDIKKIEELGKMTDEEKDFCRSLKRIIRTAINIKKKNTDATVARWKRELLIKRVEALALHNYESSDCRRLAERIFRFKDELFTFLTEENVDYHNNLAEQSIRPNVIIRKISGGNRSDNGKRNHEVIMSVIQTCQLRRQNFTEYLNTRLTSIN